MAIGKTHTMVHHLMKQLEGFTDVFISDSCSITFSSAIFVTDMQILSLESKTLKEFFLWVLIFLNRLRFLQFRCFYLLFKYITFVETLLGTDFKFTYREFSRPHRFHLGSYHMTHEAWVINKVGCVFPTVDDSILPHAKFGPNDHREPHLMILV